MTVEESRYFSRKELQCKCGCGWCMMDKHFMQDLDMLREIYGHPMKVSSAYRCQEYDEDTSCQDESMNRATKFPSDGVIVDLPGGTDDPHARGVAIDILIFSEMAWQLLRNVMIMGSFQGIGLKQHGARSNRFIHLERMENTETPTIWTY